MKILHLVFHPDLKTSRVNRTWRAQLIDSGKVHTSRDMYSIYPDFNIDVEEEQKLLLEHDRIVFQFPLYWYATPPLLKKWLDDVLTYGFAYGSAGDKLKGKDMQLIISAGGQQKYYSGFDMFATIYELMRPFQLTAKLTQMNYSMPVWMYRADVAPESTIMEYGSKWVAMIDDPSRSIGTDYIISQPDDSLVEPK